MAKPEIRLKGFEGEWKEKPFSMIVTRVTTSGSTKSFPGVEFEDIVCGEGVLNKDVSHKNIYKVGKYFDKGDVLFGKLRPYLRNILLADFEGIAIGDFWVLRPNGINSSLLYMLVSSNSFMKVANISSGSKMPRADWNLVSNSLFSIPFTEGEQKAISDYFKSLDSLLQSTTKKIALLKQMKQACLVSMFPQAGETTPRVRFKGFEGEWVVKKLSSIANRVTRKNTHLESTLPLTISAAEGLIEQTSFFNNVVASSNVSGYYLVKKGEFAYNKSYSNGYPFGAVKRLDRFEKGVLSTLYIVFSIDKKVSSDYIVQFFETSLWHQEVAKRAAEGARNHGLLNIGADDFLDINLYLPNSKDEQQRIASYFRSLDKQISLQEKRLEKLKQIKAACLDKMFV